MSLGPLYVFLGKVSVQVLCPFFNWVVCLPGVESCEFFICFGDQILVRAIIGNMFSHTVGSLLILFSLAMKKLFILMRSHLFILSFMSLALGDMSVRMLLHGMSEIFLPMFSFITFMVSQYILSLLSTLNLFFVFCFFFCMCGVSWLSFYFLACSCPALPTPFVEEAIFAQFHTAASFVKK